MTPESTSAFQLTKTNFKHFLECPREFWLRHHHPAEIVEPIDAQGKYLIRQGYEVERIARDVLSTTVDPSQLESQYTVTFENLLARFDIFQTNSDGTCSIYEVKSSKHIPKTESAKAKKDKRDSNLYDLGFQVYVARLAGLRVNGAFLVTVNGEYERGDELELVEAIHFENVTEEIESIQNEIAKLAADAIALINSKPADDFENLCTAKLKCLYFRLARPDLPEFTIYDIPGLRGDRFENLKSTGALAIADIPKDADLTDNQWLFVESVLNPSQLIEIEEDALREELEKLEYPLYFLDYETVNPAIPMFKGMRSYEQVTFQFSLHIRENAGSQDLHFEFLSDGSGELQRELVDVLSALIGETGTVVSWNKSFEQTQNRLLARLYPEHADFLESVNARMYDLGDPFKKGIYKHPDIKGWSIKNVLPVLVPDMSYDDLEISGGGLASALWYMDVFVGSEEKEQRMQELRDYCKQDTLAMVRILDELS